MREKKTSLIKVPLRTPCARMLNMLGNGFLVMIIIACVVFFANDMAGKNLSAVIFSGTKLLPWLGGVLACYVVKGFAVIVEWYGLCIHANQDKS